MLDVISNYVSEKGTLEFHEFFFNTLAMHNSLKVIVAPELSSIVYRKKWSVDDFLKVQDNLYHPVKDVENHQMYRRVCLSHYSPKTSI